MQGIGMHRTPKPNFTAWFVLQGLLAAMHHPDFRGEAGGKALALCLLLADAASKTRLASRIIHRLPYDWQYRIGELVTNPGRLRHFYLRKKEIEKQARALLESGAARQVVVLGAGLDVLALRLAEEYPAAAFIEIDTGESQAFKAAAFRSAGIELPGNVELIDGDLREPLASVLGGSKLHDAAAPTLWIAEGFFMFIPADGVIRIFREMGHLSPAGSHVVFTTIPYRKITSGIGYMLQTLYLKKEKSPFHWVMPCDKVGMFMENLGYGLVSQTPCDALHKNHTGQEFKNNHNFAEDIHIAVKRYM